MAENVFEAVKQSVSTREAAEFYGIKVSRTGMACCPFHDDKNPSMKVDQRFHCFGCGEDGDVIDFTAKLFDLSPKEAAEKLAQDFGLLILYVSSNPAYTQSFIFFHKARISGSFLEVVFYFLCC